MSALMNCGICNKLIEPFDRNSVLWATETTSHAHGRCYEKILPVENFLLEKINFIFCNFISEEAKEKYHQEALKALFKYLGGGSIAMYVQMNSLAALQRVYEEVVVQELFKLSATAKY